MVFADYVEVYLTKPLVTPDGTVPEGTRGIVLEVFAGGEAYLIEFDNAVWMVPEFVPGDSLVAKD